ncbi:MULTISPECIES: thiol reductant ABC exporter subunit CydC [unclassified Thioalkalivibrio]|uniref:thiol reductant ABC exporter subunit CydC n=1 Tax=unclassified Thioalkalivibrio TaxID=2621013 RepID=UPI00036ABE05|nr:MULTISPECIES: thiol reductant ABC exporter subunit CydC [unclassified Thioalkalivibrio]
MTDREYLQRLFTSRLGWSLLAWLLLAVTWVSGIVLLALSGWFITATALAGAGMLATLDIYSPSGGIRAAAVLRTIARYFERVTGHEAVLRILSDLRATTFRQLARWPARRLASLRSGDLQARLTSDIDTLDAIPLRVVGPMVGALLALVSAVAIALWLAPPLAAVILLVAAAITLITAGLAAAAGRRHGRRLVQEESNERVALLDYFGGLPELTAFGRLEERRAALARRAREGAARRLTQERAGVLGEQGVQLVVMLTTLAMLGYALHAYAEGLISGPVAVLLTLMTLGLNEALGSLPGAWWRLGESLEAARRLRETEAEAEGPEPAGAEPVELPPGPLEARGLSVGFRADRPLAGPLDIRPEPGYPLVVHGISGRGKTALLETLAGELAPTGGELRWGEQDLTTLDPDTRHRVIGYLPQRVRLLDDSLAANLRLGRPDLPADRLWAVLDQVRIAPLLQRMGYSLEYPLGEDAGNLSGGQARRVALAWLLLQDRPVALLDEPFAGLDEATEAAILERIGPWLEARQTVIVTHAPRRMPAHWPRLAL